MLQPMDYKESDTAKQMNNNGSGRVKRKNKELLGGGVIFRTTNLHCLTILSPLGSKHHTHSNMVWSVLRYSTERHPG